MGKIISDLQDLTYLTWTKTRHSSGTAGSFLKAYENYRGSKRYYKLSNFDSEHGIVGHECVNEIVADRLLTVMNIPHLSYDLIHVNIMVEGLLYETYLCRSLDFKNKNDKKIALDAFYKLEADSEQSPLDFCIAMGWGEYIYQMLIIDYLILNRDRHGANIELIKNSHKKTITPAPLFDHGLSLLFNLHTEREYENVNPLEDKVVQCFMGSKSLEANLDMIPEDKLLALPVMDEKFKAYLFEDLEKIMGSSWCDSVWRFLCERASHYESIRNQRQK